MVLQPGKENVSHEPDETSEKLSEEELEQEYSQSVANGKKNLLCGDFSEAVACFQSACYLQSERFGDTDPQCAEAFFLYGKALLELARVENTVLGNALKGVPETEDSESETENGQFEKAKNVPVEEREQMRHDVEAAMATEEEDSVEENSEKDGSKSNEESTSAPSESGEKGSAHTSDEEKKNEEKSVQIQSPETEDKKDEDKSDEQVEDSSEKEQTTSKKMEEAKIEKMEEDTADVEAAKQETAASDLPDVDEPCSCAEEKPSTSSGKKAANSDEDVQENPDDIPNMQLAWEMLDLAKVLFSKKPESESNNLSIAQCHSKLGELGLEVEDYEQSLGDFKQCLEIYEKYLPDTDRKLAEIHYNMGLAYYFKQDYSNSFSHYKSALNVLELRIGKSVSESEYLNELIDAKGDKNDEEVVDECTEVGEIKNLIPDINSRIEDVLMMKQKETRLSAFGECSSSSSGFSSSKPVSKFNPLDKGASTSSSSTNHATNDISHLVRRKRKSADHEQESEKASEITPASKKAKQELNDNGNRGMQTKKVDDNNKENVKTAEAAN